MPDRYSQASRVYLLDEDTFVIYEMTNGWQWDDTTGAVLAKISGVPAFEALIYNFLELACDDPGNNCLLESLAA